MQGRTQGGAEGGSYPPGRQIFLKKRSIFEKIWYFWAKNGILPPLNFFCPPLKSVLDTPLLKCVLPFKPRYNVYHIFLEHSSFSRVYLGIILEEGKKKNQFSENYPVPPKKYTFFSKIVRRGGVSKRLQMYQKKKQDSPLDIRFPFLM